MKTKCKLITLVLSGLMLAGCGVGGEPNATERAAQVAEEMAAARTSMMNAERSPAQIAWDRAVTLAARSEVQSEAALQAASAGDLGQFLTVRTEAMLAYRAAAQAWQTALNYPGENEELAMAAQQAWEAARMSWEMLESQEAPEDE